jgi:hypothetical protein
LATSADALEPAGTARELLRLRNRVGLLERDLKDAASAQGQTLGAGSEPSSLLGRINFLKQALKQRPESAIPEIQSLNDADWLRISELTLHNLMHLESEDGIRRALSEVRLSAKTQFASRLETAVSAYAAANGGQLPADILQLKAYLDAQPDPGAMPSGGASRPALHPPNYPPTEEATIQRYRMTQTGYVTDLRRGQPVMVETSPVDPEFDTLIQIGLRSYLVTGTGQNERYGWGGTDGPDLQSLTPRQRERYDSARKRAQADQQRLLDGK